MCAYKIHTTTMYLEVDGVLFVEVCDTDRDLTPLKDSVGEVVNQLADRDLHLLAKKKECTITNPFNITHPVP